VHERQDAVTTKERLLMKRAGRFFVLI